ncbi:hypothetical protein ACJX0J_011668, partial [Zea mays]
INVTTVIYRDKITISTHLIFPHIFLIMWWKWGVFYVDLGNLNYFIIMFMFFERTSKVYLPLMLEHWIVLIAIIAIFLEMIANMRNSGIFLRLLSGTKLEMRNDCLFSILVDESRDISLSGTFLILYLMFLILYLMTSD